MRGLALGIGSAIGGAVLGFLVGMVVSSNAVQSDAETSRLASSTEDAVATRAASEVQVASRAVPRRRRAGTTSPNSDLGVRPDEVEFVREALVMERARRAAESVPADASGSELLHRAFDLGADVSPALWDFESAAARVTTGDGGEYRFVSTGDVTEVSTRDAPEGATILMFGPGTFRVDTGALRQQMRRDVDMQELEIRGAGMDRTVLLLGRRTFMSTGRLLNFVIRDLTLDSHEMLLDVRGHTALRMENVRINGWSSGGHSAAIGVSGQAYVVARNCVFDAGAGRGRGRTAFSDRGATLSLFDGCTFIDVRDVIRANPDYAVAGAARFVGCTFVRSRLARMELRSDVRIRGGIVKLVFLPDAQDARARAFGEPFAASVEGLVYVKADPQSSVAQVLAALRAVRDQPDRRAISISFASIEPDGSRNYAIQVVGTGATHSLSVRVDPNGSASITGTGQAGRADTVERSDHMALLNLLEGAGLVASESMTSAAISEASVNEKTMAVVNLRIGGYMVLIDARTGDDLMPRR